MKQATDIFEYTILNKPNEIGKLLVSKGFRYPNSWDKMRSDNQLNILANALNQLAKQDEDAKMQILSYHPDLKPIEAYLTKINSNKTRADNHAPNKQNENINNENLSFLSTKTSNILMGVGITVFTVIIFKQLI